MCNVPVQLISYSTIPNAFAQFEDTAKGRSFQLLITVIYILTAGRVGLKTV